MKVRTITYSELEAQNKPSLYATPLAWAVAKLARQLIGEDEPIEPRHTAMIVVSDECSLPTMRELSRTAAQGIISPLRFAGASPSIVVGLAALELGIRGPTLSLTMQPAHAVTAVLALITHWLTDSDIVAVVAIAHHPRDTSRHQLSGVFARSAGDELRTHIAQVCRGGRAGQADRSDA
jgi:hypothetical protein